MKLGPGVQVGPYQIVEQVGRGGMATVFKAYQPALERVVAIKVLPEVLAEDPQFRERFRREAVAIAKLRHPSILTVYDHGEFENQLYIVTEFVEGGTFANELGRPLRPSRATRVLQSIASALDYAHERGVLHRDVKPSNILINRDGAAILGDFGLARMMAPTGERLTRIDMVVGTPEYMSPEQCAGKDSGPASDQYSLGVVAFEALTGHVPYEAETPAAVMLEQIQSPLPMPRSVNPDLSEGIERALLRALAKDPATRYPTCTDLVEALAAKDAADERVPVAASLAKPEAPTAALAAQPAGAPAAAVAPTISSSTFSRGKMLIAGGVVAALVIASVAVALITLHPGGTNNVGATGGPAHGSLVYDLKLNSTAWNGGVEPSPDPAQSVAISYPAGSIDLHLAAKGGGISAEFDGPALKNYVGDFVFKTDAGSDFGLNWELITAGPNEQAEVYLHFDIAQESMTPILSPYNGSDSAMTATVALPGVQRGSTVEVAVVVKDGSVTLYLNGKQVGQGKETKASGATSPSFYMNGNSGTLHILSLRYYALA